MVDERHIQARKRLTVLWLNEPAAEIYVREPEQGPNHFPFSFPFPVNDMEFRIFELFTRMIRDIPPQGVLKALDLECQMLKNDLENNRLPLPKDAFSIFYFREFVHAAKVGRTLNCGRSLPPDHVEFFKETIDRLVRANELPKAAMDHFDDAFVSDIS